MGQHMPAIVMSLITLIVCLMFLLPIRFKFGTNLVRFYWNGFWMFLALISLIAGGSEVLRLSGFSIEKISIATLSGIMASFIVFVVFAWFRLAGAALVTGVRRARRVV